MDWLWTTFQWLMVHQPPFPGSLVLGVLAFTAVALTTWGVLRILKGKPCELWECAIVATPLMILLAIAIPDTAVKEAMEKGIATTAYWYHWISMGLGAVAYPTFLGLKKVVQWAWGKLDNWQQNISSTWQTWRKRRAEQREVECQARKKVPEVVIAQCQVAIKKYVDLISAEPDSAERIREAVGKLEELKRLYQTLHTYQQPIPIAADNFDQLVIRADSIFTEVSLQQECPKDIQKRREECQPVVVDVQAAIAKTEVKIEKLVLHIESLPNQAIHQLAVEWSQEVDRVADGLRETGDTLPPITVKPLELVPSQTVPAPPRRQTA